MRGIFDGLLDGLVNWFKGLLTDFALANFNGLFEGINQQLNWAKIEAGKTPQQFNVGIFNLIHDLSQTVIVPIAGLVIAFICTYELIQMIIEKNNLHEFELFNIFKWVLKTSFTIVLVTNTWNIVMAVFDVSQRVTSQAAGVISTNGMDSSAILASLEQQLAQLDIGELLGIVVISLLCRLAVYVIYAIVFIIIISRMIEIYLTTSLAPIPMATLLRKEGSHGMGQNYLRGLFALGFQSFLIIVCIGIYSVLVTTIQFESSALVLQLIQLVAYTVLLCLTLLKTGNLAKSIFNAH